MNKTNIRKLNQYAYSIEDCDCANCSHWRGQKRGCTLPECCCDDVHREAPKEGKIKRKRGWREWQ